MSPEDAQANSAAYKRLVTLLLMTAYTFNATDRSIIPIVAQSIKLDLTLTDAQVGLLSGTAFGMFYALGGIPIARLAERFNRVNIIAASMAVWSALCALCGVAASYPQLLITRVGVGIAESGCSPAAHSLISDYFAPAERTSALSIYSCGISLGYLLAAVTGGFVAQHWGWRAACTIVGLPGIAVAVLIKRIVREPRRLMGSAGGRDGLPCFSFREELRALAAVAGRLVSERPVRHMILGVTIGGFAAYGFYAFVPAYFTRVFGLSYGLAGVLAGLAGGVAVGLGIAAGGMLADALARRHPRWYALVPAIGALLAVPLFALAVGASDWRLSVSLLSLAGFLFYTSLGPTFGVVQNVVGSRQRATATAFLYICLNVFALGGGPLLTGWSMDRFAADDYREVRPRAAGSFRTECPGGAAPAGAGASRITACHTALARSTRQGLWVAALFFAWGGLHYFLASFGMARSLREATARNA